MSGTNLIIPMPDVRLSAEQRELQRQQLIAAVESIAHNEELTRARVDIHDRFAVEVETRTSDLDARLIGLAKQVLGFQSRTFWQRLTWLVRGQ